MTYDELLIMCEGNIPIKETDLEKKIGLQGIYCNGKIVIDRTLTNEQKKCILAEELGHHFTSAGNILNYKLNAKQERKAREWGAKQLINYDDFMRATTLYSTIFDVAEELNVTEEMVLIYYQSLDK